MSSSEDRESEDLESLVRSLRIVDKGLDRSELLDGLVALQKYFAGNEDVGKNVVEPETAHSLCRWVTNVILPSAVFAEISPYMTEEKPALTPESIVQERVLYSRGLSLLSCVLKTIPPNVDNSTNLAVFTCLSSFSDESDPWTSRETRELACHLTEQYVPPDHLPELLHHLLQERVKPFFAKSKNPAITPQGRKAIDPLPTNDTMHSDLDIESKPWKYRVVYIVTVFRWILMHLNETTVEGNWPLIIPPLLALIDDSSIKYKRKGCDFLHIFLQKCPPPLLERTGLGEVFENAIMPCLMYLPSLTEEAESIRLLTAAYPALIKLALIRFADEKQRPARIGALGKVLRIGLLKGYSQAGEHIKIAELLVNQIAVLINEMGIASVKHIKYIIPILSANLAAPFATAYPPLLEASINAMEVVIINDWPRIAYYRGEILRGLTICWCRINDQESISIELVKVQESLKRLLRVLTSALKGNVDAMKEYQILIDSDDRLRNLFSFC